MATLTYKIVTEKGLDNVKHITADMLHGYDEIGAVAFEDTKIESVEIPEGVKVISSWAFKGCEVLEKVTLPETLEEIGDLAFAYCSGLESLTIPNNVVLLGIGAFKGCHHLKSIKLSANISTLNSATFRYCFRLETVELPAALGFIGEDVFDDCGRLKSIKGYDKIKEIRACAFYNTSSLRQKIYNEQGKLITYKLMHANMTCKFFQYEVGKTYEIPAKEKIVVCKTGFHSCYSPFECLNYYCGVYNKNVVMCKCIAENDIDECVAGDKIASRKITILKKFDSYAEAFNDYFEECSKINS